MGKEKWTDTNKVTLRNYFKSKANRRLVVAEKKSLSTNEILTLGLSIVAILLSSFSLYFQFFYKHNNLRVAFIDSRLVNDSTLYSAYIVENRGNQSETVLYSLLTFQSNNKPDESYRFQTDTLNESPTGYKPIVIKPGEQIFQEMQTFFSLDEFLPNDTLDIGMTVGYINKNGANSEQYIGTGYGIVDTLKIFKVLFAQYNSQMLNPSKSGLGGRGLK